MIFQEPVASLNPCFTVGFQIEETLRDTYRPRRRARRRRAVELLTAVGIPEPEERLRSFPHQMSGGQCQRVMIAIATACNPKLLIADEPTTALDVTIQKQILELLLRLQAEHGMALVLITHDMGVVAETADRVIVQYNGRKMEDTDVVSLFERPREPLHPRAALGAAGERQGGRLPTVSAFAGDAADGRAGMTAAVPVLETRGVTRDYVTGGMFGGARMVRALKGIDLSVERGRTLAVVGEVGMRQVDPRAHHHHDRRAERRRAADRGGYRRHRPRRRFAGPCVARCRSCSRTHTARSTRARRSATCWPSR